MQVQIINEPLHLHLYGFKGTAINNNYAGTAFTLMDKMWQIVKSKDLSNKGINIWVYEESKSIFSGVELNQVTNEDNGLEENTITLLKYAYFKHIGPYNLIPKTGQQITAELNSMGYQTILPYIEMYGHWTNDETKLETELLMALK